MGVRSSAVVLLALLSATASAANHVVTAQSNLTFSPSNLTIDAGDTVTFQNGGGVHNVASAPGSVTMFRCANGCDGAGGNGNLSGAAWSATVTFPTAGTIGYFCEAHGSPGGGGMAGTITVNAVAMPTLSVSDATVTEGNSGTKQATFAISLSQASGSAVTFNIATANGTATAGSDYVASSLTGQSIAAGMTSKTFNVTINGDTVPEPNETFNVTVSNVVGATVVDSMGVGTILNDDTAPRSDFNGDGRSDVFWRNTSTGANSIWKGAVASNQQAVVGVTSQAWVVAGIGDFDGDRKADVFWRNTSTGANSIWKGAVASNQQAVVGVTSQAWVVAGIGDFNGDGKSDVFWRNTSTGANTIWKGAVASNQQAVVGVTSQAWIVAGIGDFNGDGKSDVLWRNTSTGANSIWKGAVASNQQAVATLAVAWGAATVGDYNGDRRYDVIWRHASSGANAVWYSANSATGQSLVSVTNLQWKIVP